MSGTEVKPIPTPQGRPTIQGYGPDGFRVSGVHHPGAILVLPDGVAPWDATTPLSRDSFAGLVARRGDVDLVLVGCGDPALDLPPDLGPALRREGLIVEAMTVGAACRTYNLLVAEGRRVAAALLRPER
ncbi:MAG: Mth938-like domain-containing protein [Gemmatimonas sp.]